MEKETVNGTVNGTVNDTDRKETNLSEKIVDKLSHIPTKDVREAVLRLMRYLEPSGEVITEFMVLSSDVRREIKELFGEKLTKKEDEIFKKER